MRFNHKRNFDQVRADMIKDKIDRRLKEDKEIIDSQKKIDNDLENPDKNKGEQDEKK